ncbi:MAG TPA: squalene synthase [Chitinophagales bacterium]|nr:squalene synthase [Chitinophagales bacterium]
MLRELMQSAYHPSELSAMLKMKLAGLGNSEEKEPLDCIAENAGDMEFCYAALNKVSRSFAVVIRHLPDELRDAVCVFYLVLRGLDTVEDDAAFPHEEKLPLLRNFYAKNHEPDCSITGVGDSDDYRALLSNYGKVARSFQTLDAKYQIVIAEICRQMGAGMADFSECSVKTLADYDLYCHYVAGLVGIGLSKLFAASGVENATLSRQPHLSNSMGLFLQKTNIVRDYYEDFVSGRIFWPEEIWSRYAGRLKDFLDAPESPASLACLNHLVSDALRHAPDCLDYVAQLRHPDVFRFCAIPQVMAIATLAKVYNNPKVFTGVVKIRKGLAAKLMLEVNDFHTFKNHFSFFAKDILNRMNKNDPASEAMREHLMRIIKKTTKHSASGTLQPSPA